MKSSDEQRATLNLQLTQLGSGNRSVAKLVFDALWPVLVSFCRRWLNGHPEAEDCAQKAVTRIFEQAHLFDSKRDALAWALEIAMWECRTVRKRIRVRPVESIENAANAISEDDSFAQLEQRELEATLAAVVTELTPETRNEILKYLREELAGNAAGRKRRQRAIESLKTMWRNIHDINK